MSAVTRRGDLSTPHGCFPSRPSVEGSDNVFVNGLPIHRVTDLWAPHTCKTTHLGILVGGSSVVYANGLQVGRVGDPIGPRGECFSFVVQGSDNVFAGTVAPAAPPIVIVVPDADGNPQVITYTERDHGSTDDEPDEDDGLAIYPPVIGREPTAEEKARSKENGADPDAPPPEPKEEKPTEEKPAAPVSTACGDIPADPPDSFRLSPNFTLGDLSSKAVVSRAAVRAQNGLSKPEMVCNLKALAENVLEPLVAKYGRRSLIVTSGFRPGSNGSQHTKGQAADIQFAGISDAEYWERAQWIQKNLRYDQFILEYLGNRPWFHLSWSKSGTRGQTLTAPRNGIYKAGLLRIR
jgi:uncharacterized Zn-binding protein involved in type VI secretion